MDSFVKLIKVFEGYQNRNLDYLAKYYADKRRLLSDVNNIFDGVIDGKQVSGKSIFLKPNWVNHDRYSEDKYCLRTNDSLLIAIVEFLLTLKPAILILGDAPIQGAIWDKICTESLRSEIISLCKKTNTECKFLDFRKVIYRSDLNLFSSNLVTNDNYLIFDLKSESYLEPITLNERNNFRVAQYDHKRLGAVQTKGMHKYCIVKELFNVDLILSIPKVKTHQKTGITAALKNSVGFNGDKNFLPHHRIGGTKYGGDSYEGGHILRFVSERILDLSNKFVGRTLYKPLLMSSMLFWKLSKPRLIDQWGAAWYGNDTTWRMVLDINKILIFGKGDGTISNEPQRQLFSLCDGVIAGQGDGPLLPKPLSLGFLSFSNNAAINDYIFACLMKLKPDKIPLIQHAFALYPKNFSNIYLNGKRISLECLKEFEIATLPPPGWIEYFEK